MEQSTDLQATPQTDALRHKLNVSRLGCHDVFELCANLEIQVNCLKTVIDKEWLDLYGGEPAADLATAVKRLAMIADDVRCQSANFRAANKVMVELDEKLQCLTRSSQP